MSEDMPAAVAHVVLGAVAVNSMRRFNDSSLIHPGMHVNCLVHAVLGCLNYSGKGGDLAQAYKISMAASRYLPLPCLMADMYRGFGNNADIMRGLHILSGIVPFAMAVAGNEDQTVGNICIAANILSLAYYSFDRNNNQWGYFTVGAGILTYFVAPNAGSKAMYPLGLALMEYCASRVFMVRL